VPQLKVCKVNEAEVGLRKLPIVDAEPEVTAGAKAPEAILVTHKLVPPFWK